MPVQVDRAGGSSSNVVYREQYLAQREYERAGGALKERKRTDLIRCEHDGPLHEGLAQPARRLSAVASYLGGKNCPSTMARASAVGAGRMPSGWWFRTHDRAGRARCGQLMPRAPAARGAGGGHDKTLGSAEMAGHKGRKRMPRMHRGPRRRRGRERSRGWAGASFVQRPSRFHSYLVRSSPSASRCRPRLKDA
jgi:hypothetical protein